MAQIREMLDDAEKIGTITNVFFEGGEPFLYYPIMLEAMKECNKRGFEVGIVTNAYWAKTVEDAKIWLNPLKELNICSISLSDDSFHYGSDEDRPPLNAKKAAEGLGLPVNFISIEEPSINNISEGSDDKKAPVIGGGTKFKGRAVEKLVAGLPTRNCATLTECPHEDLLDPGRVHIDPFGNVHFCQGLTIGNIFKTPLSKLMTTFDPKKHPIIDPILSGGPAQLAKEYEVHHEKEYIDECHMCFLVRKALTDQFPQYLTPKQVYGE